MHMDTAAKSPGVSKMASLLDGMMHLHSRSASQHLTYSLQLDSLVAGGASALQSTSRRKAQDLKFGNLSTDLNKG